jgi:uncharacterized phiE125 gp8 family phage protein
MALKLFAAAGTQPVTLAEAKAHLRVDTTDEDALITAFIVAATEMAEQHTGRALMTQTWDMTLDKFPDALELTRTPVQTITSVTYYDTAGALQTLAAPGYVLDAADGDDYAHITPAYGSEWPATRDQVNAVSVRYVAGYANAAAVPESIKAWIKLQVSALFENREAESYSARAVSTTVKMSFVDALLDRYVVRAI